MNSYLCQIWIVGLKYLANELFKDFRTKFYTSSLNTTLKVHVWVCVCVCYECICAFILFHLEAFSMNCNSVKIFVCNFIILNGNIIGIQNTFESIKYFFEHFLCIIAFRLRRLYIQNSILYRIKFLLFIIKYSKFNFK